MYWFPKNFVSHEASQKPDVIANVNFIQEWPCFSFFGNFLVHKNLALNNADVMRFDTNLGQIADQNSSTKANDRISIVFGDISIETKYVSSKIVSSLAQKLANMAAFG